MTARPDGQSNLAARPMQDGLRVPYVAKGDPLRPGRFVFSSNDSVAWDDCWQKDLCAVCGAPLGIVRCIFVWDLSLRTSVEPAMHESCSAYAISHCPHLAMNALIATVVYRDHAGSPRYLPDRSWIREGGLEIQQEDIVAILPHPSLE